MHAAPPQHPSPPRNDKYPPNTPSLNLDLLPLRKLPYPLFLAPAADQELAVFLGDDEAVEALEDHFAGIFGVDDAVVAFEEAHATDGGIAG